jgi:hypothetical protein
MWNVSVSLLDPLLPLWLLLLAFRSLVSTRQCPGAFNFLLPGLSVLLVQGARGMDVMICSTQPSPGIQYEPATTSDERFGYSQHGLFWIKEMENGIGCADRHVKTL